MTHFGATALGASGGTGGQGGDPSSRFAPCGNGGNGGQGGNGAGGAFCGQGGLLLALNITAASNSVAGGVGGAGGAGGGGYFYTDPGAPGMTGSPGSADGDSIASFAGSITVKNSILCAHAPTNTNIFGTIVDGGNNIDSDAQNSLTNSTSLNGVNPSLTSLGNYGGPTPTMALLPGSPAIDAADPADFPATDQRGVPRPFGPAPDIGAFESTSTVTVSGQITGLMPGDEVTVASGHQTVLTTNGGGYSFSIDYASFLISPSSANYVFAPLVQAVSLASNQTGVNFQAYRLNSITLSHPLANSLNLVFAGTNGQSFRIETTTNFISWTPITTNIIGATGYVNDSLPVMNESSRFFRVVSP